MISSALPIAFLMPVGLWLAAWADLPTEHRRESAMAAFVVAVVSLVAYAGFGFAVQFGGVGLSPGAPAGLGGLDTAWSPFDVGRWSFIGLEGFLLSARGASESLSLAPTLALHRLPAAVTAGLIPALALGTGARRVAIAASAIASAAIVFPVAGAWVWGGGWLAMLGLNLNLGHGAIDPNGSGVVYFAAAGVALTALRLFGPPAGEPSPAARSAQPVLAILGMASFSAGWGAWAVSDPFLSRYAAEPFAAAVALGLIAAAAAAAVSAACGWLISGQVALPVIARGWIAGQIAVGAAIWFIAPGPAIVIGAVAGLLAAAAQAALIHYRVMNDRAGTLAAFGLSGAWGCAAVGFFADGSFGTGWNGVAQGVRGLLAADAGQLSAQLGALAAIGATAVGVSAIVLFPVALAIRSRTIRSG